MCSAEIEGDEFYSGRLIREALVCNIESLRYLTFKTLNFQI